MIVLDNPLQVDELAVIAFLSIPFVVWGYRHGLDAIIIAVVGVLIAMAVSDGLANGVVSAVNTITNLFVAIFTVGFGSPDFFPTFQGGPGLIQTPEQVHLFGTVVFGLISYVSFKIAFRQAGGKESFLEGAFGALGGAATGYLIVTFVSSRHVKLTQTVLIVESETLPSIELDATVVVLIALVIIVFGVTSSRRGG